jgi:hypothetical protein
MFRPMALVNHPRGARALVIAAILVHAGVHAAPEATLLRVDGTQVTATPTALAPAAAPGEAGEAPDWVVTMGGEQLTLKQTDLFELRIANPAAAAPAPGQPQALVVFNNGDSLSGELKTVDDTHVTLRTPFAGDLKFRRDMIGSLRMVNQSPLMFSGPAPAQWTFAPSEGAWSLEGDSLISKSKGKGEASATLTYPEKFRLGVDLEWKHDPRRFPRFSVVFLANEAGKGRSGYELFCQERYVDLRKRANGEDAEPIGFAESVVEFIEKSKLRLELLVNTQSGLVMMLVDGRTVETWQDPAPISPNGANLLRFLNDNNSQELRVSRVTLQTWDGDTGAVAAENPADALVADGTGQDLVLRNGDIVRADQLLVSDGIAAAKTIHGDLTIPTSRIRTFAIIRRQGNQPTPKKFLGDVRGWFPGGGHLTFRLDAIKDGKLTGFSQLFGTAEFPIDAFERIELNAGNLRIERLRPKLNW